MAIPPKGPRPIPGPIPRRPRGGLRSWERIVAPQHHDVAAWKKRGELAMQSFHPKATPTRVRLPPAGAVRLPPHLAHAAAERVGLPPARTPGAAPQVRQTPVAHPPVSSVRVPPQQQVARLRLLRGGLGDDPGAAPPPDPNAPPDASAPPDPGAPPPAADPNAPDAFGVPNGHTPQSTAWVTQDLWAALKDADVWFFKGVRAQFRLAWPAIDNSQILCRPNSFGLLWNEYGNTDPQQRMYDNCTDGSQPFPDNYAARYSLDDLRWHVHSPMGPLLNNLLGMYAPHGSHGIGTGQPLYPVIKFARVDCDLWALDKTVTDPALWWFHPLHPIPLDLLSYRNLGLVPDGVDGSASDFWSDDGEGGKFIKGAQLDYAVSLIGAMQDSPFLGDSYYPGRIAMTVYFPTDIPKLIGKTIQVRTPDLSGGVSADITPPAGGDTQPGDPPPPVSAVPIDGPPPDAQPITPVDAPPPDAVPMPPAMAPADLPPPPYVPAGPIVDMGPPPEDYAPPPPRGRPPGPPPLYEEEPPAGPELYVEVDEGDYSEPQAPPLTVSTEEDVPIAEPPDEALPYDPEDVVNVHVDVAVRDQ